MGGEKTSAIAFNTLPFKIKTFIKIPKFKGVYSYLSEVNKAGKKMKLDFYRNNL